MYPNSIHAILPGYRKTGESSYSGLHEYSQYIQGLCSRNPSLRTLHSFLVNPNARSHGCPITALDFRHGTSLPESRAIYDLDQLINEVRFETSSSMRKEPSGADGQVHGRLLIIEDLTAEIIQLLGSELDLDPLFLATHLHTVHRTGMRHQTPDDATLPSRLRGRDYLNVSYHQPVSSDVPYTSGNRFSLDTGIDRKLVFLRATNIGLVQHRVSIIKVRQSSGHWLGELSNLVSLSPQLTCQGLILVDPPLGNTYFREGYKGETEHKVHLSLQPYLGTYENFMELPKFSEALDQQKNNTRLSMMDDLVHYWKTELPVCFEAADPSIQSLAYYPLRIVAAEWVKYIAVMQRCIKLYEYESSQLDLNKFNMDIRELQGWRRRTMMSLKKVQVVIRHLSPHASSTLDHAASVADVLEDYKAISDDMENAGRRLENMLPVVTSLVQIIDARQSFAETANISRLTILALVFVPLSFVSSLFSMNSENVPGSEHFWVYFAVAIPVTAVVFLIARPPTRAELRKISTWLSGLFRRKPRLPRILTNTPINVEMGGGNSPSQRRTLLFSERIGSM